jgi:phenylacetate-CoA ligase
MSLPPGIQHLSTLVGTLRKLKQLRSQEGWTTEQVRAHQEQSLAAIRAFAAARSPFYRAFHHGYEAAPLEALPVLTKALMMEHFEEVVTDPLVRLAEVRRHLGQGGHGLFQNRYEVVSTSGSTGNPGLFLFDPNEWTTVLASFARAREWAGARVSLTRRSKMAVVSSTNERNISARVGRTANTPFIPTLRLDASRPLREVVSALNGWQPDVLVAYASMAYELAQAQLAGTLQIAPSRLFTSSEVLTARMRRTVEQAWGAVVFNTYAATETATIAAECQAHHGMHVFEDLLIVENVDEQNRPVPLGEFGDKLLVTVLFSRTQPLIRYEISDSVQFATHPTRCDLPFTVITAVQGRRQETLRLPGQHTQTVEIHPNVFHDVMDAIPSRGWQIVQQREGLRVLVVPAPEGPVEEPVSARLAAALQSHGAHVPSLSVEHVEAIPKAESGKAPLIVAYREPPQPAGAPSAPQVQERDVAAGPGG